MFSSPMAARHRRPNCQATPPGRHSVQRWALFSSEDSEAPRFRIALEFLITKIEQEMPLSLRPRANLYPVVRQLLKEEIAAHLVKLTPRGRELAKPTLTTVPTLVIHGTEAIPPATPEAKLADIFFLELRVKKRIQKKREHNIALPELHLWIRGVRLRIPVRIQL
jgi:hypothetical protein